MNLVIDIGNTAVKVASFNDGNLEQFAREENLNDVNWESFDLTKVEACLVSSVRDEYVLPDILESAQVLEFTHGMPSPIAVDYESMNSLGADRYANAVAVATDYPDEHIVVVDIGTCLKVDVVARGSYLGGSISPGLAMRTASLHEKTGKLPLIQPVLTQEMPGRSTFGSINNGVVNGMLHEINGFMNVYEEQFGEIKGIGTGGGFDFFEEALKSRIFADNFLTLRGLDIILNYNT